MAKQLLPKDFAKVHPWSSVTGKAELEYLACEIMKEKGESWDDIPFESAKSALGFSRNAYNDVNKFCKSQDTAICFSKSWARLIS